MRYAVVFWNSEISPLIPMIYWINPFGPVGLEPIWGVIIAWSLDDSSRPISSMFFFLSISSHHLEWIVLRPSNIVIV